MSVTAPPAARRRVVDYLDPQATKWIADALATDGGSFAKNRFLRAVNRTRFSERLFDRADQIADILRKALPSDFEEACRIIVGCLPAPRQDAGYGPMVNFRLLPLTRFVSRYGISNFECSMSALYELTRRFTSEFDVRPFIEIHEDLSLEKFLLWRADSDPHVRRLVTEGTRTRLPWCSHLKKFQVDPSKVISLIAPLREDSSKYVRLSVANNLADLLKDDLDRGLQVAARWASDSGQHGKWVVKHALRYFARGSNQRALAIISQIQLSSDARTVSATNRGARRGRPKLLYN
jgi:3-methyladenine DNA glycosylase AlkC